MTHAHGLRVRIRAYSLPLLAGVAAALLAANQWPQAYARWIHEPLTAGASFLGHPVSLRFLINEVFMVFFFGIAAKEITDALLPGGVLNPPSKAVSPLLATLGGILGPVGVFFLLVHWFYGGTPELAAAANGWGVPTATDIALAWLAARLVFGAHHPAVSFLLLLAVADDAIGLVIIAVFYPDPLHAVEPLWLLLTAAGLGVAFGLRRAAVRSWVPYVLFAGGLSWLGLLLSYLHPALALVLIVPFLPARAPRGEESTLARFEHACKAPVEWGLFAFGLAAAGVVLADVGSLTWVVLLSLVLGKTVGVFLFAWLGERLGFLLPAGMGARALLLVGLIAGTGLTVALFVAGEAYPDRSLQGQAKMGALLSGAILPLSLLLARAIRVRPGSD